MRKIILLGTLMLAVACNSNENNTGKPATNDTTRSTQGESPGNSPGSMNTDTSHMDTMHSGETP